jgi:hypothetical protein
MKMIDSGLQQKFITTFPFSSLIIIKIKNEPLAGAKASMKRTLSQYLHRQLIQMNHNNRGKSFTF